MNKTVRQYLGMVVSVLAYYVIHEGAHLIYALYLGVFKKINMMGLGIQIDVYNQLMTNQQMGIFCLVGALSTLIFGYFLVGFIPQIKKCTSKVMKACLYYLTLTMLFLDPLYLSVVYKFVGGGDMNGISLLISENYVSLIFGGIFFVNLFIFIYYVVKQYQRMF